MQCFIVDCTCWQFEQQLDTGIQSICLVALLLTASSNYYIGNLECRCIEFLAAATAISARLVELWVVGYFEGLLAILSAFRIVLRAFSWVVLETGGSC